jgi:hypothetical protein
MTQSKTTQGYIKALTSEDRMPQAIEPNPEGPGYLLRIYGGNKQLVHGPVLYAEKSKAERALYKFLFKGESI